MDVIIKTHTEAFPPDKKLKGLEREFHILNHISLAHGLEPINIIKFPGRTAVAYGMWRTERLMDWINDRTLDLLSCVKVAEAISEGLIELHKNKIVHQRLYPANILVDKEALDIKLIGFEAALNLGTHQAGRPHALPNVNEPRYMAPEQTGRLNMSVDMRADLYSFGACLYHMISGSPPFDNTDPLDLIHSHIARTPQRLDSLDSKVPGPVAEMVSRLLSKDPEDRYQSAVGLCEDLKRLSAGLKSSQDLDGFDLGKTDDLQNFKIPDDILGRDRCISILKREFDACLGSEHRFVLISGEPGVGKTSLGLQLAEYVRSKRGKFYQGRFLQLTRTTPYKAIIEIFAQICRNILSDSDKELERKRGLIKTALGANAGVLTKALPELEMIIGPQPDPLEIGAEEAKNRFRRVVTSFAKALNRSESPMVIFIDDLQWADSGSLKLMEILARSDELKSSLFIGAYRSVDVSHETPAAQTIEVIKSETQNVTELDLKPLSFDNVLELTGKVFPSEIAPLQELTEILFNRSSGNPLFVKELLRTIHQNQLARFHEDERIWKWSVETIKAHAFSDNVLDLIVDKINNMPGEVQDLLKVASCAANNIDAPMVANLLDIDEEDALKLIHKTVDQDFLVKDSSHNTEAGTIPLNNNGKERAIDEYHLVHDRVRQAAYSLLAPSRKRTIHREIGQLLLLRINSSNAPRMIFEIVSQLNLAAKMDSEAVVDYELAALNMEACRFAHESAAYEAAYSYSMIGVGLLGDDAWEKHYKLALDLHLSFSEAAFLCSDFDLMDKFISIILKKAVSLTDKIKAYEIRIQALVAQGKNQEAMETALPLLINLGVKLPASPSKVGVIGAFLKTRLALVTVKIDEMIDLPEMKDQDLIAAMKILARLASAAYVTQPELVPVIAFKMIRLSLKQGATPATAYAYTGCGLIFCQVFGNIEMGYQFGELAIKLVEKFDAKELKALTTFSVNCFIKHWKRPLAETLPPLEEAIKTGLETGDLEASAAAAMMDSRYSFFVGTPLVELDEKMEDSDKIINQAGQISFLNAHRSTRQTVRNLMECPADPCALLGDIYDENTMVDKHHRDDDARALLIYHFNKLYLCCLFNRYDEAVTHGELGEAYLEKGRATHTIPLFHFYYSLALLRQQPKDIRFVRRTFSGQATATLKKFKLWAKHSPENHLRRKLTLEAEFNLKKGNLRESEELYKQAVSFSKSMEYINEQALANELAGEFYLNNNGETIARAFFEEAIWMYRMWGANSKALHIQQKHNRILKRTYYQGLNQDRAAESLIQGNDLDMSAAVEASQLILGEIRIEKLIKTLMRLALAVGGAQKAFLVTNVEGQLKVEAKAGLGEEDTDDFQTVSLENCPDIPVSIVSYVARTKERLTLNDASRKGMFTDDPHVKDKGAKSILCAPIIHHNQLSAVLYLENNLTINAFTPDRIEVLHLICSQAAISLENARLYRQVQDYSKTLEKRVAERTKELKEINIKLVEEIGVRQDTEKALKESEKRFRDMAELMPQFVFEVDTNGDFLFLNRYGLEQIGHTEEKLRTGLNSMELFTPEDKTRAKENMDRVLKGEIFGGNEYTFLTKDGDTFPAIIFSAPIIDGANIVGIRGVGVDISEAKKAEEKIKSALVEKEALLREIHHRVKNNLQIMTSLLSLQRRYTSDEAVKVMLMDARNRVASMSLIHELLYESEGLAAINVNKFIKRLTNQIAEAYGALNKGIKIKRNIEELSFGVDTAIPIGFLTTELVSNAFKHAFPNGGPGEVEIGLSSHGNNHFSLYVKDNGVGMPENSTMDDSNSLGLRLLNIFTDQLDARLEINSNNGVECIVKFKRPK